VVFYNNNFILHCKHPINRYWPYGSEGCQIHGFQGFVAALSSISSCAAIAWDRYHQYCTRSKLHWSTSISVVMFVWGFSAFWSMMPLFGWGEYDYEPLRTCCTLDYSKADRMNTFSFFTDELWITSKITDYMLGAILTAVLLCNYSGCNNPFAKVTDVYKTACYFVLLKLSPGHIFLQMPAVLAKMSPAVNAYVYGLGNENYRGGIWQFLTGQKIEKTETDNKAN
ncbi:hypothetical protein AB205_0212880, partial [Aquarana catesbeiana]